jgi:hypothetical protein
VCAACIYYLLLWYIIPLIALIIHSFFILSYAHLLIAMTPSLLLALLSFIWLLCHWLVIIVSLSNSNSPTIHYIHILLQHTVSLTHSLSTYLINSLTIHSPTNQPVPYVHHSASPIVIIWSFLYHALAIPRRHYHCILLHQSSSLAVIIYLRISACPFHLTLDPKIFQLVNPL